MARSRSRARYSGLVGPSGESYEVRRRRAAIYRDTRKLREAQEAARRVREMGRTDAFTLGLYDGRVTRAEGKVMEDWDALRRRQERDSHLMASFVDPRLPVGNGRYDAALYPQGALFDPDRLGQPLRRSFERTQYIRSHQHAHRNASHHVGPCGPECRRAFVGHEHRARTARGGR
jgi:hypothetical protein